jgi:DNA-binding Xre family transcriptional regulator
MKEVVEKTDFRNQVVLNNKKKIKPYAIYNGVTYTLNELVEILGISRVSIGNMKSGKFENRFNLEFIDNGRKKLNDKQKNKISNTLNKREPSYYAIYEGIPYTFKELLEILKIGRVTLFNLKRGKGRVDKYNLIFL